MQPAPYEYVISDIGCIAQLAKRDETGWHTRGGGYIEDEDLHHHWRLLHHAGRIGAYSTYGTSIGPATAHVPWHEAAGRRLPDGTRIMRVEHDVTRSPVLVLANCEHHDVDTGGTVEVLA